MWGETKGVILGCFKKSIAEDTRLHMDRGKGGQAYDNKYSCFYGPCEFRKHIFIDHIT